MKKIILIFCVFTLSFQIFSQKSILDEKNGFKNIKLGTLKDSFQNLKATTKIENYNYNWFEYLPSDNNLYLVFDSKYEKIKLGFDIKTDMLNMIYITKTFTGEDFADDAREQSLKTINKFVSILGNGDEMVEIDNSNNEETGIIWYAKSVSVSVTYSYYGIRVGKSETIVKFEKVNLLKGF